MYPAIMSKVNVPTDFNHIEIINVDEAYDKTSIHRIGIFINTDPLNEYEKHFNLQL